MSRTQSLILLTGLSAVALVGCADGTKQADDLPPMIVNSHTPDGENIELEDENTVIWVQVYDEDEASLTYQWVLSDWGEAPDEIVDLTPEGSQITLERNMDLHRQVLTMVVSDASSSARMDWELIVKPE